MTSQATKPQAGQHPRCRAHHQHRCWAHHQGVSIVEGKLYVNGSPFIPDNCGAILPGGISSVSKYYVEPTVTEDEFFRYNNTQIRSAQVALQEAIRKAGTI